MECGICYEKYKTEHSCFLACGHSLCKDCRSKLVQLVCPFCRNPISIDKPQVLDNSQYSWPPSARSLERREERNRRLMVIQPEFPGHIWFPSETETSWSLRRLLRIRERHRDIYHVHREIVSDSEDQEDWEVFMIEIEDRVIQRSSENQNRTQQRERKTKHRRSHPRNTPIHPENH